MPDRRTLVNDDTPLRLEEFDQRSRCSPIHPHTSTSIHPFRHLSENQHYDSDTFTLRTIRHTVIPGGLEDLHALLNSYSRISLIIRWINAWKKGYVHTERFSGDLACLSDSLPEGGRGRLGQCGEDAWTLGVSREAVNERGTMYREDAPRPPAFETAPASRGTPTLGYIEIDVYHRLVGRGLYE